ncbi:MAG: hypothetical protein R3B45_09110 [Bdellovibrionota bacterium]
MDNKHKPLSALHAIGGGYNMLKGQTKRCLTVAVFTMLLPQLVCEILFSYKANNIVESLEHLRSLPTLNNGIYGMLTPLVHFFPNYLFFHLIISFLFVLGYFAIFEIIVKGGFQLNSRLDTPFKKQPEIQNINGQREKILELYKQNQDTFSTDCDNEGAERKVTSHDHKQGIWATIKPIFANAFKKSLPHGLIFALLAALVFALAQTSFPFLIFVVVLTLMGPVLIRFEKQKGFEAFRSAIFLKYLNKQSKISKLSVFFVLTSVAAFFYLALYVIQFLKKFLLEFDQIFSISRSLWSTPISHLPFSLPYIMTETLTTLLSALLVCFLPAVTTHLYLQIYNHASISRSVDQVGE